VLVVVLAVVVVVPPREKSLAAKVTMETFGCNHGCTGHWEWRCRANALILDGPHPPRKKKIENFSGV
jgi:hypothetical protein